MVDVALQPANAEQKKNFVDLMYGEKDLRNKFSKQLTLKEKECTENHVAFCYPCAKIDFDDEFRKALLEITRNPLSKEERESKKRTFELDLPELEEYSKPSYFDLVNTEVRREVSVIDGIKVPRPAYMEYNYKCKKRKHGITVQIPWHEHLEKEKGKTKNG